MSRVPDHDRPWEQPGSFRRDCEPHRGGLLFALGQVSLLLGCLALFCLIPSVLGLAGQARQPAIAFTGLFCGVPSVLGLAVGVPTWVLARRDLGQMEAGLMDPGGRRKTQAGLGQAKVGVVLCVTVLAGLLGGLLLYLVM
jgi:hypothetical protein